MKTRRGQNHSISIRGTAGYVGNRPTKKIMTLLAAGTVLVLLAGACGNDDDDSVPAATLVTATATPEPQTVTATAIPEPQTVTATAIPEPQTVTAEELLAKVINVYTERNEARATGDADLPAIQANSTFSMRNQSGSDLIDIEMVVTTNILSNGDLHSVNDLSQAINPDVPADSAFQDWLDTPPEIIIVGDRYYTNRSDINSKYGIEVDSEWAGTILPEPVYVPGSRDAGLDMILKNITGQLSIDEAYTIARNVSGNDQFFLFLLESSSPDSIIGTEILNGHEVNRLRVKVPLPSVAYAYLVEYNLFSNSVESFGIPLPLDEFIGMVTSSTLLSNFDLWIDDRGLIHRLLLDGSEAFLPFLQASNVNLQEGDIEASVQTDIVFYDDTNTNETIPTIAPPPSGQTNFMEDPADYLAFLGIQYAPS